MSDLDLNKALEICRAAETSQEQLRDMEGIPLEASMDTVTPQPTATCSRCGRAHGARRCPATRRSCHRCKGFGHFSSMCRSKPQKVQRIRMRQTRQARIRWACHHPKGTRQQHRKPSKSTSSGTFFHRRTRWQGEQLAITNNGQWHHWIQEYKSTFCQVLCATK